MPMPAAKPDPARGAPTWLRTLASCLLVAAPAAACAQAAATAETVPQVRVWGKVGQDELGRMRRLAGEVERELRALWPAATPARPPALILVAGPGGPDDSGRPAVHRLVAARPERLAQADIIAALLSHRLAHAPQAQAQPVQAPGWLVAAVQYRVTMRRRGLTRADWYAASRAVHDRGHVPTVRRLLDHPIPPWCPLAYEVYADACGAFLQVLLRREPSLRACAVPAADQRPAAALAAALFPEAHAKDPARAGARLQQWYADRLDRLLVTRGHRLSVTAAERRVEAALALELPAAGPDAAAQDRLPLAEVRDDEALAALPEAALTRVLAQLHRLRLVVPPLLEQPVATYTAAVEALRRGRRAKFRRLCATATQAFAAAAARHRRIRACLLDAEAERGAPLRALRGYLPLIEAGHGGTRAERAVHKAFQRLHERAREAEAAALPAAAAGSSRRQE